MLSQMKKTGLKSVVVVSKKIQLTTTIKTGNAKDLLTMGADDMARHAWKKVAAQEEKQLEALLLEGTLIKIIGERLGHSSESVMVKMNRLGLHVVGSQNLSSPTTCVELLNEIADLDATMLLLGVLWNVSLRAAWLLLRLSG